jgi:ADP-dependent NAD(P)H-hydrate dehydratase / NAD(P)H-hydrate epimerase
VRAAYDVAAVRAAETELFRAVDQDEVMLTAARHVFGTVRGLLLERFGRVTARRVVVLVGSGNNGGDALFAAAMLAGRGAGVLALTLAPAVHERGAAALRAAGGSIVAVTDPLDVRIAGAVADADVVIDGIVGIGASGSLRPEAARVAALIDGAAVVAVDLPSGIDPGTGQVADPQAVIRADVTVTFGCLKPGLVQSPGRECCGVTVVADIGLGPALAGMTPVALVLDNDDADRCLHAPSAGDYKYSHGVVGVCAGSRRYPGAAHMVTGAARHGGVGMVRYWGEAAPEVARAVIERFPDVVSATADVSADPRASGWVVGPGFGTDDRAAELVAELLACELPVALDADALTLLSTDSKLRARVKSRRAPTVITPHVGEFQRLGYRLTGDRIADARAAAADSGAIVVLKGPGTVIADPEGRVFVDVMGTSALATAGTGDALAGLVGALLARRSDDTTLAVAAAVYVHGLAGRIAATGERPVTAWDVVAAVPAAVAALREG